jgi:hypothetical protein
MSTVGCKGCNELVDACKCSAQGYMSFVLNVLGAVGDDALLASKGAARLARECKETRNALLAHLRQEHPELTAKSGS